MAAEGFSWYLILVVCVVFVLVVLSNVYIIVEYGHPEDKNQAWIPKIVVLLSLTVAESSVLLFPLDVANTGACSTNISPSSCHYTLPMTQLWWGLFIANIVLVFCVIPFTLFLYEADSDFTMFQKIKSAVIWTLGFLSFIIVIIVIAYFLGGYVEYPTQQVTSGTASMDILIDLALQTTQCILPIYQNTTGPPKDGQCDAFTPPYVYSTWKLRVSLPTYIMAIQSVLGWVLFMVFAGVGMFGAPIDWIKQWVYRPKGVITKSEYMKRARIIAQRAKEIMNLAQMMRRGERDRRWRSNYKKLQTELLQIEDDEYQLERVFPQGEDGDVKWVLYMISFWVTGFVGVLGLIVSTAWIVHIAIYMLPPTPIYGFLNEFFTMLDDAFALLGVIAFSFFCLYLLVISMKGNFLLGLNFVFVNLYPVKPGATMMSSFLVNSAIILLMSPAILQFCATAFPIYATGTSIFDVFGNQVSYLQGIKYIYNLNIFLYCLLSISVLSALFMAIKGRKQWKRRGKYDAYLED